MTMRKDFTRIQSEEVQMAVEKILQDYALKPLDLYSFIAPLESLPDINELRKQGFSDEDTDRIVKKMFSSLVQRQILLNNPKIVRDQTDRVKRFGVIRLGNGQQSEE